MTRTMYDAVTPKNIPRDAQMVAGYLNGPYAWKTSDWAMFPNAVHVGISVRADFHAGQVLDVEPGDATPAQAVDWVLARRSAGMDPTIYCNMSTYPYVESEFVRRGVMGPYYWIARPGGSLVTTAVGRRCFAVQYSFDGIYDRSVVADFWPGVDAMVINLAEKEDTMFQFEIPAMPTGDRYCLVLPTDRACAVSLGINGTAHLAAYAWVAQDGGNGFQEVDAVINDHGAHVIRPPRGTVKLDLQLTSDAVVRGVVDIVG